MFGLKKNKVIDRNISANSPAQPGQENITLRTMQDDLDAFDGKISLKEEKVPEEVANADVTPGDKVSLPVSTAEKKTTDQPRNPSPFLDNISRQENTSEKEDISFLSPEGASNVNMPEKRDLPWEEKTKLAQAPSPKKGFNWGKFLIITFSLIIVIALGFGGYYFWMARERNKQIETPPQAGGQDEQAEKPEEPPAKIEVPGEKFSTENPNFLTIDTESATPEKISDILKQKASEIKDYKIEKPVEFIVTDSNNNPVAFHIFAQNAGIKLSTNVFSSLDEKFSLYCYNYQDNVRLGVAVDLEDKTKLVAGISQEEKTLVKDLTPLFLGNTVDEKLNTFNAGKHNGISVRYVNLDANQTISVDYAVTDEQLIIGTSKYAMWAILDKTGQGQGGGE